MKSILIERIQLLFWELMFFILAVSTCSQSQTPSFQNELDLDDTPDLSRIYFSKIISISNNMKYRYEYHGCRITVTKATFENNIGFGFATTPECGGAIFTCLSVITLENENNFTNNSASVGGAAAFLETHVFIQNSTFSKNKGYKHAGAIYFQGNNTLYYRLNVYKSLFIENNGTNSGGAIYVSLIQTLFIDDCIFKKNHVRLSGGALQIDNSDAQIQNTRFVENQCKKEIIYGKMGIYLAGLRAHGGGAIAMIGGDLKKQGPLSEQKGCELITSKCCFSKNSAENGNNFEGFPCHDILFEGKAKWASNEDTMIGNSRSVNIGKHLWRDSILEQKILKKGEGSNCQVEDFGMAKEAVTDISNKNNHEASNTFDLPSPSSYTYVATPITQNPRPTTRSHKPRPTNEGEITPIESDMKDTEKFTPITNPTTISVNYGKSEAKPDDHQNGGGNKDNSKFTLTVTKTDSYSITETVTNHTVYTTDKSGRLTYTFTITTFLTYTTIQTDTNIMLYLPNNDETTKGKLTQAQIILLSVFGFIMLLCLAIMGIFLYRRSKASNDDDYDEFSSDKERVSEDDGDVGHVLTPIEISDVDANTNPTLLNFDEETRKLANYV